MNAVESEVFYAVTVPKPTPWTNIAMMEIPKDSGGTRATVLRDSATAPLEDATDPVYLVVLQARTGRPPELASYGGVWIAPVGPRVAVTDSSAPRSDRDRVCSNSNWIAAFFIRGFGARPSGPLVLSYSTNGITRRLRVDPAKHTVDPQMLLHLTEDEVKADSFVQKALLVRVRSSRWKAIMPVLLWREPGMKVPLRRDAIDTPRDSIRTEDRWEGVLGIARGGNTSMSLSPELRPSPVEWRMFVLDAPAMC